MRITVIGCGRWGSFIAWYLDRLRNDVTLYGRSGSPAMARFEETRKNDYLTLSPSVKLSYDIAELAAADVIVISINSQGLRPLMESLVPLGLQNKTFVLCMKGIEITTGKRLTEVAGEFIDESCSVAVWLGPGHVQDFLRGIPNCMVIDSSNSEVKEKLVNNFSSSLIRFYYGQDLIGNEIGGGAKNVLGIAAGMLDGMNMTSLKGALMSRGTREIARLIAALGGDEQTAYGLCLLGDYEATLFSAHSHNRRFGEAIVKKETYTELAEGYYTVKAMMQLEKKTNVELPICNTVYDILYNDAGLDCAVQTLFSRKLKTEIY